MVRPTTNACAECKRRKRICPACKEKAQITLEPPIESGGRPTRTVSSRLTFEEEHHSPQQHTLRDQRQVDHKRRQSPPRPASRKSRKTTTTAATPTATSTLDSWLLAASVEAAVAKAAKLLALADTPAEVAAQVQGQIRELATEKGRLESEVAAAERKTKNVEAKLKRAETSILKLRLEVAAVLQADYEPTERHKALLAEAVGTGYGPHESGKRLLRMHAAEIVEHIQRKAGDDIVKQMELGKAVHGRLSTRASSAHEDETMINAAIVDSVREWCATLKTVYNGRFPNEVRAGYLKVLQSVGLKCTARRGPYTAAATARVLGVKAKHLIIERLRWEDWLTGDTDQFLELRVAMRRDKFPEEWADFIVDMWLSEDITRQSESAVHVCRNPKSRKDKYEYRIHWLEKKNRRCGAHHQRER